MSKKKRKMPKSNVVWRQSAEEATLAKMPRYNGYVCGHGAHGDAKYNRTKAKRALNRQFRQEGASRGSFRPSGSLSVCSQSTSSQKVEAFDNEKDAINFANDLAMRII